MAPLLPLLACQNDYQILYTYDDSGSTNHIALAKINNAPSIDTIADQDNTTLDSVNLQGNSLG